MHAPDSPRRNQPLSADLLDHLPIGVLVRGDDGQVTYYNCVACVLLGLSEDELLGRCPPDPAWRMIDGAGHTLAEPAQLYGHVLENGRPQHTSVIGILRPAGGLIWLLVNAALQQHPTDDRTQVLYTLHDVSTLILAQNELHESKGALQALFTAIPDLIIRLAPDGTIRDFKPPQESPSIDGQQFVGRRIDAFFPPPVVATLLGHVACALTDNAMQVWEYQTHLRSGLRDREARIVPCGDDATLIIVRDITDRKRAEVEAQARAADQLELARQAQALERLNSLMIMAGGIAHDFNNLLAVISGQVELLEAEAPAGAAQPALIPMAAAIGRAAQLTSQLLDFSGHGHLALQRIDAATLLAQEFAALKAIVSPSIALTYTTAGALFLDADPSQLRQLLRQLVLNAAEAIGRMPGHIAVGVELRRIAPGDTTPSYLTPNLPPGLYLALSVVDNGPGIPASDMAYVFEPFFSTRAPGRGLGLPAALGIVRGHHGTISLHNDPGGGTVAQVLLPLSTLDELAPDDDTPQARRSTSARTALVIDDEPGVRTVVGRALERLGLQVLEAADGQEGLELFQQHKHRLALVLLDLTMPRVDGATAARSMQALDPMMPIILMSGYNRADALRSAGEVRLAGVLHKPFSLRELRELVQEQIA